jgi:hypothetical protein
MSAAIEVTFDSPVPKYAEQTMRKWRAGTVQMSGTVAERLFSLLPPRMPLTEKYKLVETLWTHVGPRSKKIVSLGLDAGPIMAAPIASAGRFSPFGASGHRATTSI